MLPVLSGIEVCRQIRRRPNTRDLPVIMVTARTEDQDAVRGLNTGADDYITKPFNMDALLGTHARFAASVERGADQGAAGVSRHADGPGGAPGAAQRPRVTSGPHRVPAAGILSCSIPRRVFSREELLDAVWGPDIHVEPRTVDVHIRRLRKSLNARRRARPCPHGARGGLRAGHRSPSSPSDPPPAGTARSALFPVGHHALVRLCLHAPGRCMRLRWGHVPTAYRTEAFPWRPQALPAVI